MRLLELSGENKKKVEELVAFASRPENRYKPGTSKWVPGDRREFVRKVNTYRLVFTVTETSEGTFRHMSLSVPKAGKLPNTVVAFTLATWCGFTGGKQSADVTVDYGKDWMIETSLNDGCVILVQRLKGT